MKKKLLSILTALAMCLSLMPTAALAGDCESCVDEDGDYYCDTCWEAMEHDCIDEDSDYCCDICWETMAHDCIDEDLDHRCDRCMETVSECVDSGHDHWCDMCGELTYQLDDDNTCAAEGCDARAPSVSGRFLELSYRSNAEGETVADGKAEISAFIYDMDKYLSGEPFDPAAGTVSVVWTETKTVYDENLGEFIEVNTEYPSEGGVLTVDENGKAVAVFHGIPVRALNHGNLVFEPANPAAYMPAHNGMLIEYEDDAFVLDVSADVDMTINGVQEYNLYFLTGTEVTVAMAEEADGTFTWTFDEEAMVPGYEDNGTSITFVMPEGEVYLTFEFVCSECADMDDDHWCDICRERLSECGDEDGDHNCDLCQEWLSDLCIDEDTDHVCDDCYGYMEWRCIDEDGDHACDVCWSVLNWLCEDKDHDHYCDEESCGVELSECEDEDGDHLCEICGAGIYPSPSDLNVEVLFGDGQVTVTWSAITEQIGGDALANYTVYVCETETQTYEEAEKVTFTPDECTFEHTFTGLTNDVEYEVGVEAVYTLVGETGQPESMDSSVSGVPVSASAAAPGAPEIQSIAYGDGSLTVTWTAPAEDGGAMIREYAVEVTQENWSTWIGLEAGDFNGAAVMSCTVEELTNGESYTVSVSAANAVDWGEADEIEARIPLIPYEIAVGGVRITEDNMNDVLGDGTVTFDPDERVMTLNNADVSTTEGNYGIHTRVDLTIELVGENKVSCTGYYGLLARKALTICGEGSLDIAGSDFGIYTIGYPDATLTVCDSATVNASAGDVVSGGSFGIRADGVFTVRDDAVVNAVAGKAPGRSCGIYAYTRLNVEDNGRVTTTGDQAQNDSYGIRTTDITVSGGELSAIGGEGVYLNCGIFTQGMEILGGTVNATAGTTISGPSVGLHVSYDLTISGNDTVVNAVGGDAPGDASTGIYVGDVMTVDGGVITANSGTSGYTYGMEVFELNVNGGSIRAQAGVADPEEGYSWGIQASNGLNITGGSVSGIGGQAGSYSYGIQTSGVMSITGGTVKAACGSAQKQFALWSFEEMNLDSSLSILVPVYGKTDNSGEWYWTISDGVGKIASQVEIGTHVIVSGGGGGSFTPTYAPNVDRAENGAVSVSPKFPVKGDKVTVKTQPDEGYVAAGVVVTDKKGNAVEVTDNGDGTFSFVQPAGKVDISISFEPDVNVSEIYTDVEEHAWYHDAVEFTVKKGLMSGVSENSFAPLMDTDRAMIVTILWARENKPVVNYLMNYSDVAAESWYTEAIRWAASEKIISGYGDNTFGTDDPLTREQLATILYSYEKYKGGGFVGAWMFRLDYPDAAEISDWAYEAMCWMTMKGIMSGKDGGILDPKGTATRAETAQMLMNFISNQNS